MRTITTPISISSLISYLVLAEQRQVEENLKGLGVRSHDDQVGDASVKSLGSLVRTLLQLLVVGSLLHQVQQGDSELSISERVSLGVGLRHF